MDREREERMIRQRRSIAWVRAYWAALLEGREVRLLRTEWQLRGLLI